MTDGSKARAPTEFAEHLPVGALEVHGGEDGLQALAGRLLLEEGVGDELAHAVDLGVEIAKFLSGAFVEAGGSGGRRREEVRAGDQARGEEGAAPARTAAAAGRAAARRRSGRSGSWRGRTGLTGRRSARVGFQHRVKLLAEARARLGRGQRVELAGDLLQAGPFALAGRADGEVGAERGGTVGQKRAVL